MVGLTAGLDRPPLSCPSPQSPPPLPVPAVLSVWVLTPLALPTVPVLLACLSPCLLSLSPPFPPVFLSLLLASVNKCFRKLFSWVTGGFWLVRNRP